MFINLFLWHDLVHKVNEFYSHVRVGDSSIEYHRYRAGQLSMNIDICSKVALRVDHCEYLRIAIQIGKDELWEGLKVKGQFPVFGTNCCV